MTTSKKTLGQLLKELRIARGLRLCDLAAQADMNQTTLTNWENDRVRPLFGEAIALLRHLGVDLGELNNVRVLTEKNLGPTNPARRVCRPFERKDPTEPSFS
jgi:transcriptional regulator with XRE-family HTH domain